jgi:predicted nucleic acid-binding protein
VISSEKDLPVLASAVLGKADVLVTGDGRNLLIPADPTASRAIKWEDHSQEGHRNLALDLRSDARARCLF